LHVLREKRDGLQARLDEVGRQAEALLAATVTTA
jgi:hypothetical protein